MRNITITEFGLIVKRARESSGTQSKFVEEVNKLLTDPKEKIIRQFVVSLEGCTLKRPPSQERVSAICQVLKITQDFQIVRASNDVSRSKEDDDLDDFDCLPLIKALGALALNTLSIEQFLAICRGKKMLEESGLPSELVLLPPP